MGTPFVHLHLHTDASLFDGFGTAAMYAQRARELGMSAMAITDHGTMRGIYDWSVAFEAAGVKPIYGCEMYVSDDAQRKGLTEDEREIAIIGCKTKAERKSAIKAEEAKLAIGKSYHIVALALNEVGFANLCRLTSWAWTQGFYKKPKIDLSVLAQHHEGLFVTSACRGGLVGQAALNGDFRAAVERVRAFKAVLGRRFALEVQPHHVRLQHDLNRICSRIAHALDVPLIAGGDAHYPWPGDKEAHEVAICIGTKDMMTNPAHFKFDEGGIYHVTSEREMMAGLLESLDKDDVLQAMSVASLVGQAAQPVPFKLKAAMPFSEEASETLRKAAYQGLWEIKKSGDKRYVDQVEHELQILDAQNFAGYFVMVADVINAAREKGILIGPGRGSAAGSLVAYLVGITAIDPIVHGLSFSRFISADASSRASGLPDIDSDVPKYRRQEVVEYIRTKYGDGRVCQIGTMAKQKRSGLKDVARVMGVPFETVNVVAGIIEPKAQVYDQAQEEDEEEEPVGAIKAALLESDVGRQFNDLYPDVADYADRLLGQTRSVGIHAAGVVISSVPLDSVIPLETRSTKKGKERVTVAALDMHGIEARGLVKLDVLGLKTLDVLSMAVWSLINEYPDVAMWGGGPKTPDEFLRDIPLDDQATLDAFTSGRFSGVFQFDTQGAREFCRGIKFRSFDDIVTVISLNRPGPKDSGLAEVWKLRHAGEEEVPQVHPLYDEVVAPTLGVLTFQEQVLEFLRRIGYTPPEADKVRKTIGKKTGFDVETEAKHFVPAAVEHGLDAEFARDLLVNKIVPFAGYAFARCLDESTLIAYSSGIKRIDSFSPGDRVRYRRDDGVMSETEVVALHDHGLSEAFEVELDGGESFACSLNHRFETPLGKMPLWEILRAGASFLVECEVDNEGRKEADDMRLRGEAPLFGRVQNASGGVPSRKASCREEGAQDSLGGEVRRFIQNLEIARGAPGRVCCVQRVSASSHWTANAEDELLERGSRSDGERVQEPTVKATRAFGAEDCELAQVAREESGTIESDLASVREEDDEKVSRIASGDFATPVARVVEKAFALWLREEGSGFCPRAHLDRGGRFLPLQNETGGGGGVLGLCTETGRNAQPRSAQAGGDAYSVSGGMLLDEEGRFERQLEGVAPSDDLSATARRVLCRKAVRIRSLGLRRMYDLEVVAPEHNFVLANGVVTSNSHAAPYALISYWCMYLRVHHPKAFYLAALDVEEKQDAVRRLVGEARGSGIVIRGPEVNASGRGFTAAEDGSILCGLSSIKGVGVRAAHEVATHRPYTSLVGLLRAVDRRIVNRKIVSLLVRAGALDALIPSAKYVLERWNELSPLFEKKKLDALEEVLSSAGKDRSLLDAESEIDAALRVNEVCPLAPQVSPGRLLCDWIEKFTRKGLGWTTFAEARRRGHGLVPCSVVEHKGKGGSIRLSLSDVDGDEAAVRFQSSAPGVRRVLSGTGHVVLAGIAVQKRGFLVGSYLLDLPGMAERMRLGEELGQWERLVVHSPLRGRVKHSWTKPGGARRRPAIVLTRKEIHDKHGQLMAFVGIEGGFGEQVEFPVFSYAYTKLVKKALTPGNIVLLTTRALDDGGACVTDAEIVKPERS